MRSEIEKWWETFYARQGIRRAFWRGFLIGAAIAALLCIAGRAYGVEIVGPPGNELLVDPIEPGRYVRLGITDVDKSLLTERGLLWYPQDGVDLIPATSWDAQEPFLLFRADKPGFHQIGLFIVLDGVLDRSVVVIQVGEGPDPAPDPHPDPEPEPKPDPVPPPPVVEPVVIIIEETSERTPEQFRAMAAPAWRKWVLSRGGMIRIVDKDIKDEDGKTPEDLKPWIDGVPEPGEAKTICKDGVCLIAKTGGLPHMYFTAKDGIVRWEGAFLVADGAILKILEEHGGEK